MNHRQPSDLILDLGGNPLSSMEGESMKNLLDFLGYPQRDETERSLFGKVERIDARILEYLDIDTRSVGGILKPEVSQFKMLSKDHYIDEWGIERKFNGRYWDAVSTPLKGAGLDDLDSYPWPIAFSISEDEIDHIRKEAENLFINTDYIICAEHPVYGVFELGCWLCGFDDFLVKLLIEQDFVRKLFDIILSYQLEVIDRYYSALGNFIHYTSSGDDFGTQENLFMSPDVFREIIKPYYKTRINRTKTYTEAYYLHHSCGSVRDIINDLIEAGVDILNPVQPEARGMEAELIKPLFGDRIVLHGGIGTQEKLFQDPDAIEDYVRSVIEIMNRDGGYILAAAHNLQDDLSPESIVKMFKAARRYGKKNEAFWNQ
ncbi:MAG: uroporphyrinogen decarboxylase family protein [Spirochaetales bacterium]|uniref:Uroporphyrinogen decarboxylase family protein n=1 Tax=Candidatus Thalassospirochaeta sargassi TaxID=3119039 RepID=A0AAJ1IIP0_9SPIO|nr:uroporphyrinogen decarboxylase family protein [Spirochaetales bacterium]